jgi:outer membrane protein TolC
MLALFTTPSLLAQAGGVSSPAPNVTLPGPQNPFLGSAPEGKVTADVLQIDFKDAIDRGLRNNLGLLLAGDQTQAARGERWKELSDLLPNLSARVQEDVQTQSLAALGFNKLFPLLAAPGNTNTSLPRLVPAFNYFDARAYLSSQSNRLPSRAFPSAGFRLAPSASRWWFP